MAEIEKNVPLPKQRVMYPFKDMQVGDSVLYEAEGLGSQSNPAFAARAYAYRSGKKFAMQSQDGGAKVRIWRVS